jgi:hypothetical protein
MEPIGLSIEDTGRVLGGDDKPLSRATVYRRIKDGTLEAKRICGRTVVTVASIKAAVENAPSLQATV